MSNAEQKLRLVKSWEYWVYPELAKFALRERAEALHKVRHVSLDTFETIGITVALIVVVAVTKYSVADLGLTERTAMTLANFVIAIPLLVIFAGPSYVRRVRRGLRGQLKERMSRRPASSCSTFRWRSTAAGDRQVG